MRKFILLLFFAIISNFTYSQMVVKEGSFHKVDGCITIPVHYDDNDVAMAVIKISTENISEQDRAKLYFEGNLATFIEVEQKVGEVWVYVTSRAATFLKIQHPDFGTTEFTFPVDIEPKQCYEMVLVSNYQASGAQEKSKVNYLVITTDHDDASIYIDDEYVSDKEASKPLPIATNHTWRIECKNYHTESGTVTITSGDAIVIEKTLRPAYGYLEVNSQPEQDAIVFIDGERVGKTPYKSDKLHSGDYKVRVVKEMYQTIEETVTIKDGETTTTVLNMAANFVNFTVTTDNDADIYIDNIFKAKGKWSGKMEEGAHFVEARKQNHKPTTKNVTLILGKDETLTLDSPQPIVGMLDVNSSPIRADIYLDGELVGQTPKIIENIPCGTYMLIVKKQGYVGVKKNVEITDGEMLSVNETLVKIEDYKPENLKTSEYEKKKSENLKTSESEKKTPSLHHSITPKLTFFNANAAYSVAPQLSYGLTFGRVKKVGWYLSAMSNFSFDALNSTLECDENGLIDGRVSYYNGEKTTTRLSVVGGMVFRVAKPLCLKLGAGCGTRLLAWQDTNEQWVLNNGYSTTGIELDAGMMLILGNFNISLDAVTTNFNTLELKVGVGFN